MAKKPISFWHRLLDLISPQLCVVCGKRLSATEDVICIACNLKLPRTDFSKNPYDNEMAKLFWGRIPIERAAAFFYYESGRKVAVEFQRDNFFDGIDGIVPIPLAKKRFRQRGYNQSEEIARGINEITGIPIYTGIVKRTVFKGSQTRRMRWDRQENVEYAFSLVNGEPIIGKHLLVIDDVVTTGATIIACAKELVKAGNVKISVLSLGLTKR